MPTCVHRWGVAALTAALLLAGCGGSSQNAGSYRRGASAACRANQATISGLTTLQRTQHLTVSQLSAIAARAEQKFLSSMHALHPPSSLTGAASTLLADLSKPEPAASTQRQQLTALLAHERVLIADYNRLGLTACSEPLQAQLAKLTTYLSTH